MDSSSFSTQLLALGKELHTALDTLDAQSQMHALYDRLYRMERAKAYLRTEGKTVGEREAKVDLADISGDAGIPETERRTEPWTVSDLKYRCDIAEGMKNAAKERVRAAMTEISALQSLMSAYKSEAEFDRTGPRSIA